MRGAFVRFYFRNAATGFAAGRFELKGGHDAVDVRGPISELREGQPATLTGQFETHPKYGRQFRVTTFEIERPQGSGAVRAYLGSGMIKGVGPALSERIVAALGETALDAIEADPRCLLEVPGIGEKKAKSIQDAVHAQMGLREVLLFLHGHGLSPNLATKILKAYGQDAARLVKNNPYRLSDDLVGVGFQTADEVARKIGVELDSPERRMAAVLAALSQGVFREGSTCRPRPSLVEDAARLVRLDPETIDEVIEELVARGKIVVERPAEPGDEDEPERVYPLTLHVAETGFARAVARLLASPPPDEIDRVSHHVDAWARDSDIELHEDQREAIELALTQPVSVITGGPGVGKTAIIRGLCEILHQTGERPVLAAPTGRAAKRLAESTGFPASTIPRLLDFQPGTNRFLRNDHEPIDADLVVIDESSMLDQLLAYHLIRAIAPATRLVFVGDSNQLPSVGPGQVLSDLIDSGRVPVSRLTKIFRQAENSRIITAAYDILAGRVPDLARPSENTCEFYFVGEEDPERALTMLARLVGERIPEAFGFDPIEDVQILSPMYRGALGVDKINETIGTLLVPTGPELILGSRRLRAGDKVLQVRNNYNLDLFNGDMGRILDFDQESAKARIRFGHRELAIPFAELDQIVPAYGITVHRSQGSEYPAVIVLLDNAHYLLQNRHVLYTAVTRAKNLLILLGSRRALERAIARDDGGTRCTGLAERLR